MMKKIDRGLLILKYMLYVLTAFLILLVWIAVFILQGGIGLGMSFYIIPVALLPILLYSTLACWLLLKMFDYKKKVADKKKVSLITGVFLLVVSILFQHLTVSKRMNPFVFQNEKFSHLEPIHNSREFKSRILLSADEILKLILTQNITSDVSSYMLNMLAEADFAFKIKEVLADEQLSKTCKNYKNDNNKYRYCIVDFQEDIFSQNNFSSTGIILNLAVGAASVFEIKKKLNDKYPDDKDYISLLILNELIESSLIKLQEAKTTLLNKDKDILFTMGHELKPGSIVTLIEHEILYKFLYTSIEGLGGLASKAQKKTALSNDKSEEFLDEHNRLKRLQAELEDFQKDGFTSEKLKIKEKEVALERDAMIESIENESFVFSVATLLDFSLSDIIGEELVKNQ